MIRTAASIAALAAGLASAPAAAETPISLMDSFRIGSGAGVVCSAQLASVDPAAPDMFDRAYAVTCRDASVPVGDGTMAPSRPACRVTTIRVPMSGPPMLVKTPSW